jgi:CHAT domain-containing protein
MRKASTGRGAPSALLAGAETRAMTLCPVSDYVTRSLMTAYYTGLKQELGMREALRFQGA